MTTYRLTGITAGRASCDHCGRNLARLFRVEADGQPLTVGRTCAKNLTGWSWSVAQAERAAALCVAEMAAAETFGELWVEAGRHLWSDDVRLGHAASAARVYLRDWRRHWSTSAEAAAFVRDMLAEVATV